MNITEIRRAVDQAYEAALCNAESDAAAPTVHLTLDEAESVGLILARFEGLMITLECQLVSIDQSFGQTGGRA